MSITIAMYSHDSVGLGHARRNRALAHALAAELPRLTGERVHGMLIAGHPDSARDSLPAGWDWLVLPGFDRTPEGYSPRRMGVDTAELARLRGSVAAAALDALSPDLFVADRHPFGVAGELRGALDLLRARGGCTTVLGLRDVLDAPTATRAEWARAGGPGAVAAAYDQLWVYGDAAVYDPRATGEIPAELVPLARMTGYLSRGRPEDAASAGSGGQADVAGIAGIAGIAGPADAAPSPTAAPAGRYVLTMVGGGSDGGRLARAAAACTPPPEHEHVILAGPQMPEEELAALRRTATEAPAPTRVLRTSPDVPGLLRRARAVVSMAGYNAAAEVMATSTPALLVPRRARRAEQPLRARALAEVGAAETLAPEEATPAVLGAWFAGAVHRDADRTGVDLDGLARVAPLARRLLLGARPDRQEIPVHA